ncbi:MAG TPA: FKBP-type peptidyl-prolyl cis-trans isomerase [Candidatus Binatia bacterium]|nr:FKBP-type peptidyl-prolyl cis-trans isomerase [Candidatus Binatia bacterium]
MAVKEHDFVELDYTGRLKDDSSIFDTTEEKVAKEHQLKGTFAKVTICLGKGHLLHGLEKKLIGKELGTHKIELKAEEAFGKKNAKLLNLIPTQNFIKQGIRPEPGMPVNIDGHMGTVRAVTGGRTIVDFNHPLSGKDVVYEVTLHKIITDPQQKVASLVKVLLNEEPKVTVLKDDVTVSLKEELPKPVADELAKEITATAGVKHVTFLKA